MLKHPSILALLLAGFVSTTPVAALAQSAAAGTLDPTFGRGGKVLTQQNTLSTSASQIMVSAKLQADGRIVVVAPINETFGVVRFLANGQLDSSFGAGGVVMDPPSKNAAGAPQDLTIQPDGKIVVVGGANFVSRGLFPLAVARLNPDGSLDATFGGDGNVLTQVQHFGFDTANVVLLQPDGKIVVGGTSTLLTEHPPPADAVLLRYNTDGSLDAGFGTRGKVLLSLPGGTITALALQTDGKILTNVGTPFVRVLPNGTIDPSQVPGIISATAHTGPGTFQPDGRYVLTGAVQEGPSMENDVKTVRFTADGAVDPSFASKPFEFGKQSMGGNDVGTAIALQADGKVIVGGFGPFGSFLEFGVSRLNTYGTLDQGFGTSGGVITPFNTQISDGTSVKSLVEQPDGKILAVGIELSLSLQPGIALARYLP